MVALSSIRSVAVFVTPNINIFLTTTDYKKFTDNFEKYEIVATGLLA